MDTSLISIRLRKALRFTAWICNPVGHAPQIGDNDSGRFLKLAPDFDLSGDPTENHLDHRHLLGAGHGFFGPHLVASTPTAITTPAFELEAALMGGLAQDAPSEAVALAKSPHTARDRTLPDGRCLGNWEILMPDQVLAEQLNTAAFSEFGLYVYRSSRMSPSVRCGPIGTNGRGPHAHNDQLSVELVIDGEDWVNNLGSFPYTPLPKARNAYRSVMALFAPRLDEQEPGILNIGLFYLEDEAKAECDEFSETCFLGHHHGFGAPVYRHIRFTDTSIHIIDILKDGKVYERPPAVLLENRQAVLVALQPKIPFSPGYGICRHG
jgi:hypothetical protein